MQNIAVIYLLDAVPRKMLFFSAKEGGISQWLSDLYFFVLRQQLLSYK